MVRATRAPVMRVLAMRIQAMQMQATRLQAVAVSQPLFGVATLVQVRAQVRKAR